MASMKSLLVLSIVVFISGNAIGASIKEPSSETSGGHLWGCLMNGDLTCVKDKVLDNFHSLVEKKSLEIFHGVDLVYTGDDNDKEAAEKAIKEQNWRSLLFGIFPRVVENLFFGLQEGRGHSQRFLLPALAAGGFYALLLTLGLVAAKFLAFKSLLVGKISLVLAAVTGLSKLANKSNNKVYVVEQYGHYDHHP